MVLGNFPYSIHLFTINNYNITYHRALSFFRPFDLDTSLFTRWRLTTPLPQVEQFNYFFYIFTTLASNLFQGWEQGEGNACNLCSLYTKLIISYPILYYKKHFLLSFRGSIIFHMKSKYFTSKCWIKMSLKNTCWLNLDC